MAVNYDPAQWQFVEDIVSIKKDKAANRDERRDALDWCLENKWASKDIGCVERVDTATKHGWKMSPYRSPS